MIITRESIHSGERGGSVCSSQRFSSDLFQPEFSLKFRVTAKILFLKTGNLFSLKSENLISKERNIFII